jgi:hypothetical protein
MNSSPGSSLLQHDTCAAWPEATASPRCRLRARRRAPPAPRWSGCRCGYRCCRTPAARTARRHDRRRRTRTTWSDRSASPARRWWDRAARRHARRGSKIPDRDHVVAALRQIFEGEITRPHIDRRRPDHRDRFHAVENFADVIVVVGVVVHRCHPLRHCEERSDEAIHRAFGCASRSLSCDCLRRVRSQ